MDDTRFLHAELIRASAAADEMRMIADRVSEVANEVAGLAAVAQSAAAVSAGVAERIRVRLDSLHPIEEP